MDIFDAAQVAEHFQLGQPRGALEFAARGQQSALGVCRLETERGCYAVKRFEVRPHATALAIETAAVEAGLPMPKPVMTAAGQLTANYQAGGQMFWIRVYSWIAGVVLDWGCVDPEISVEMGKLMAQIHRLPVAMEVHSEDPALQWSALGENGWAGLVARAKARRLPWAEVLRESIPGLLSQEAYLAENRSKEERRVPSQRDLHPPNIVTTPGAAFSVVDWDSAGPVVARQDVAKYALVWATPEQGSPLPAAVHAFIDGYRDGGAEFESRGTGDLLYQQQTLLWWLLFNIRRDLSTQPGPDPDLTPALLRRATSWNVSALDSIAALIDY